ncbi:MAG TPA: DEAD/DEAH box helicase, partial [Candidatus Marinimicrobia bacterium]|nr:DEAD/DEAH box helicase [Candidatus Neomarinimicrobiota bacterium]
MASPLYCDLVFAAELYVSYTYLVPEKFQNLSLIGRRLVAPFGPRNQIGYCVSVHSQAPDAGIKVKSILRIQDEEPLFSEMQLRFYRWIADYYLAPFGMVLRAAHPAESGFKREPFLKINADRHDDGRIKQLSLPLESISQKKMGTLSSEEQKLIRQLLSEKLLVWENRFPPMMKERVIPWVRVIQKPEKKLRGRQAELLDWLNSRHPAEEAISTIMENLKISASPIQTLIKNGILERYEKRVILDPFQKDYQAKSRDVLLSDEQIKAVDAVIQNESRFFPMLLQGITGSGKTEVYIAMARHMRNQGKDVLILVPEIGITPHVAGRFRAEFGKDVAIWHSQMSAGERLWTWNAIQRGEIHVVVGARSALFSPFKKIGLIIVDEEHDASYKQDDPAPRYSARDAAVWLANKLAIPIVLGSATPSLESYYLASTSRYHRFELIRRHG